ncbi:hypothetical protein KCTC32516_01119 [Polaribacter huanghezhanensis]|uniref:hypothetical protein n=1 Tax=Polaribacter huanghezhanensis TaxID=1354726 RepID=UPI00264A10A5|nr:hypothetical protein [Polaribacter huanghezhanensis]WKD85773.1 hypothetical protein KCTC32516_01119 [Polaribacter huanghezhanensis]
MIKFWKITNHKNIDVIVINDNTIYKGKIKNNELSHFSKQIDNDKIPNELFSIPFSYIKRIENQEVKNFIKIYFGDASEEEFVLKKLEVKNEVFNYLKEVVPNMNYSKRTPSIFQYAKPQIFAILFTTAIFLWSLYYAILIENGVEFELIGQAGLLLLIFSIGLLGVVKVVLLYILIIGIATYSLIRKNKTRTEIEILNRYK